MTAVRRELGAFSCIAIGLTTIVGSGIFALPPILAASVGPLSFLAFLGAAIVVSLIGLMTAEAGGTTNRQGGAYQYAHDAFGPVAGFSVAWLAWVNNTLSLAGVSLALVKLLDAFAPGLGSGRSAQLVATAVILVLGAVNVAGARPGAAVSNVLTVAKLAPLVLFAAIGLYAFDGARFVGSTSALGAAGASGVAVAVYRCIWAAGGFENVGVVAGEVTDPKRMVPRAVLWSIGASSVLYVLVQLAAVSSVPDLGALSSANAPGSLALPIAGERAGAQLGGASFGALIGRVMLIGATVSMLGYCAGAVLVGPRYLFAMAEGRFVPRALVAVSARGAPVGAIIAATGIGIVCVWALDFLSLLDASVLFSLIQHATTTLAAWRLRRRVPSEGRFVAPGGALVPLLALASIVALCTLAFWPGSGAGIDAGRQFLGLGLVMAIGAVVAGLTRVFGGRVAS